MRDEDIHIGDVLRIRQWDDMANEFGVNALGSIDCRCCFTTEMIHMCGKQFTVSNIYEDYGETIYNSMEGVEYDLDGIEFDEDDTWDISADMLEPYIEEKEWEVADDEEIKLLFE